MSLLDDFGKQAKDAVELARKELAENYFWTFLLKGMGARGVELDDDTDFVDKVKMYAEKEGRPLCILDCRTLKKWDAVGFLERLTMMPKSPRPIVIIQNITEIPVGNGQYYRYVGNDTTFVNTSIYDDPQYVENILVHSWKNDLNHLTNKNGKQFDIIPHDYIVFLTWSSKTSEIIKNVWRASDGLGWIGSFNDYKKEEFAELNKKSIGEIKEMYNRLNLKR